ncbi:MAG: Si-specific NAD(P)(+) transhydrogenase [Ignavibacteriales bacterium]|nr:Si-specific NAD(P)(+) transhydrogenase [Ignavibacteriales bacterium]
MTQKAEKHYDLIVIGSGPAGEKAAVKAAYFKKKVALIEQQPKYGGAGVHTGTMPSKTLKETALFFSGQFGSKLYETDKKQEAQATIQRFMHRKNIISDQLNNEVLTNILLHGVDIFHGQGIFADTHTVWVHGSNPVSLTAEYIIIATGSYPFHPPEIPFDDVCVHDSDSILNISSLPASIIILGAGVIGCEYATIFSAIGSKVTLINASADMMPFLDKEITANLHLQMSESGISTRFDKRVIETKTGADKKSVTVTLSDGEILTAEMFLYAAGRCANTQGLQCGIPGIALGKRDNIAVNEYYQTTVPHIYAVGDVIGFPALASTGMDQGRSAVSHIFKINDLPSISQHLPYGIYTIPEVSMIGITEEQAIMQNLPYAVGKAFYADMPRGRILGVTNGLLKLVFSTEDNTILGVHIIGPLASEIIHYGMLLVQEHKKLHDVVSAVFNYPTLHDLYKYAAYDALSSLRGYKVKQSSANYR